MTGIPGPIAPPPRLLMGPGPISAYPSVLQAMSAPLVGQYDPFMTATMKPETRGDAFAEEQAAPDGAGAYERLAAFAGRTLA